MGQPVSVIEKASSKPGVVRFSTNRSISGTGHDYFASAEQAIGVTPSAELARRIFARGGVATVHINGSVVTVSFEHGGSEGVADIIANLYTYYTPGVMPPTDDELLAATEG